MILYRHIKKLRLSPLIQVFVQENLRVWKIIIIIIDLPTLAIEGLVIHSCVYINHNYQQGDMLNFIERIFIIIYSNLNSYCGVADFSPHISLGTICQRASMLRAPFVFYVQSFHLSTIIPPIPHFSFIFSSTPPPLLHLLFDLCSHLEL